MLACLFVKIAVLCYITRLLFGFVTLILDIIDVVMVKLPNLIVKIINNVASLFRNLLFPFSVSFFKFLKYTSTSLYSLGEKIIWILHDNCQWIVAIQAIFVTLNPLYYLVLVVIYIVPISFRWMLQFISYIGILLTKLRLKITLWICPPAYAVVEGIHVSFDFYY